MDVYTRTFAFASKTLSRSDLRMRHENKINSTRI